MANSESTETNQPGLGEGVPIDRPVRSEVADGTAVPATGPGRPHDAREAAPRADAEQDTPAQVSATELNALRETLQFAARAPTQIPAAPAEVAEATSMRLQQTQDELTAALHAAQPLPHTPAVTSLADRAQRADERPAKPAAPTTRIRGLTAGHPAPSQGWAAQRDQLVAQLEDVETGHQKATELWHAEQARLIAANDEERRVDRAALRQAERQLHGQIDALKERWEVVRKAMDASEASARTSAEAGAAERARLAAAAKAARADAQAQAAERDALEGTLREAWADHAAAAEGWADERTQLARAAEAARLEAAARAAERDELAAALCEAEEQQQVQGEAWAGERDAMRGALAAAQARWQRFAEAWAEARDRVTRALRDTRLSDETTGGDTDGVAPSGDEPVTNPAGPVPDVQARVEGYPATLVALSPTAAEVLVPTSLQCNQQVDLTLVGDETLHVRAGVVSAEPDHTADTGRQWHRVGLLFVDVDPEQIGSFCADR